MLATFAMFGIPLLMQITSFQGYNLTLQVIPLLKKKIVVSGYNDLLYRNMNRCFMTMFQSYSDLEYVSYNIIICVCSSPQLSIKLLYD
jgi:hypothetical protein